MFAGPRQPDDRIASRWVPGLARLAAKALARCESGYARNRVRGGHGPRAQYCTVLVERAAGPPAVLARQLSPRTAFWRGFVPCFARAFPANAVALAAFEGAMRTLPYVGLRSRGGHWDKHSPVLFAQTLPNYPSSAENSTISQQRH